MKEILQAKLIENERMSAIMIQMYYKIIEMMPISKGCTWNDFYEY